MAHQTSSGERAHENLRTGTPYTLDGVGSSYHTYSLVYDPLAESADLFVDTAERISDYTGFSSGETYVGWGAPSSDATGRGHFNSVQWDVNGVPEPSSVVILLSGALALVWLRRKKA